MTAKIGDSTVNEFLKKIRGLWGEELDSEEKYNEVEAAASEVIQQWTCFRNPHLKSDYKVYYSLLVTDKLAALLANTFSIPFEPLEPPKSLEKFGKTL